MAPKKNYLLDTSVCLTDADAIYKFDNHDLFLPLKVLEEIDKHKKRQDSVGSNARRIIRTLDELRSKGNLSKGVRIRRGAGILRARSYALGLLPPGFDDKDPDNQILATALSEKKDNPRRKVVVVSRDINMRVKCDALNI